MRSVLLLTSCIVYTFWISVLIMGLIQDTRAATNDSLETLEVTTLPEVSSNVTDDNITTTSSFVWTTERNDTTSTSSSPSICVTKLISNLIEEDNTGYIVGIVMALFVGIGIGVLAVCFKQKCSITRKRCLCLKSNYEAKDIESVSENHTAHPEKSVKSQIYVKAHISKRNVDTVVDEQSDKTVDHKTEHLYEQCQSEGSRNTYSTKEIPSLYANTGEGAFQGEPESELAREEKYEPISTQLERPSSHLYDPLDSGDDFQIYVN